MYAIKAMRVVIDSTVLTLNMGRILRARPIPAPLQEPFGFAPSWNRSRRLYRLRIETVLTFHPVLPMRAEVVASVGAALALFAMASLLPSPPRASVAQMPPVRAPIAAPIAYSRDSLAVLSRADSLNR
jgi:hypothetical protein